MSKKDIVSQIEDIKTDICNEYCRWPIAYKMDYKSSEDAFEACLNEKCAECPLNKL